MKSYYSIIKFVNNQWSNENIVIGLLAISGKEIFLKFSDKKLKIAKKLNSRSFKLFNFSLKQLVAFSNQEKTWMSVNSQEPLIENDVKLNTEFIKKLHSYNSGVLQFSEPEPIEKIFTDEVFKSYYDKIVDNSELENEIIEVSEFKNKIEQKLYSPLKGKVNVNYELKKGVLPDLYFDFHFDNIGVNGSIIAAASIDFNGSHRIDHFTHRLTDYESVISKLKKFAISKGLGSDHLFYLIADSYNGKTPSNMELDSMLKNNSSLEFNRISSNELDKIVKCVNEKKAHKFTDLIEEGK